MALPIHIPAAALADICRRYAVRRLSLFGSVLGPDFTPQSDVDVLINFHEPSSQGFRVLTT